MSYAIDPTHPPGREIARVIRQQTAKIAEACPEAKADVTAFVHKARVRCKKIRAALRLGRKLMGDKAWKRHNRSWRDAARGLSEIRDASARLDALEAVRTLLEPALGRAAVIRLKGRFEKERVQAESGTDAQEAVQRFCASVAACGGEAPDMAHGDAGDIAHALGDSYRAARRAMKHAENAGTTEALHEWRKRAKAHALQMRLARRMFPMLEPRIEAARAFVEQLGELQDIEVLAQVLENTGEDKVLALLDQRRLALEAVAWTAGRALFEPKRKAWAVILAGAETTEKREAAVGYRPQTEAS